ncbi:hypothetical protein WN51_12700 [Melipona quadrifasciata]|uniref:Uncharacterized protein n=1 Tax=Melipona quadrifasciata TaxID=166423 RepID=A0A0M9A0R9_9HYME|nr:hypothetical protein WN51_12700 [Melipona quadrifasciata]
MILREIYGNFCWEFYRYTYFIGKVYTSSLIYGDFMLNEIPLLYSSLNNVRLELMNNLVTATAAFFRETPSTVICNDTILDRKGSKREYHLHSWAHAKHLEISLTPFARRKGEEGTFVSRGSKRGNEVCNNREKKEEKGGLEFALALPDSIGVRVTGDKLMPRLPHVKRVKGSACNNRGRGGGHKLGRDRQKETRKKKKKKKKKKRKKERKGGGTGSNFRTRPNIQSSPQLRVHSLGPKAHARAEKYILRIGT